MSITAWIATAVWALVCSLVSAGMLAFHAVALPPPPEVDARLEATLRAHATAAERNGWRMVHVIYQKCACSRRILEHLVTSARPEGVRERVVLVDGAPETKRALAAAGFVVDDASPETLRNDWHIESAPLLLIADADGLVQYAGGYTTQKQGLLIEDLLIFARVRGGIDAISLPLFGCAVSRELKNAVDPLGLKRLLDWRPLASKRAAS